jgi:toxin ParE1/3/4
VEDIDSIAAYVSEYDPSAAANVIRRFIARWELLAKFPYSGVSREDIHLGVRHLVLGSYLTFLSRRARRRRDLARAARTARNHDGANGRIGLRNA